MNTFDLLLNPLTEFYKNTSFYNFSVQHIIMLIVGLIFIYLAIKKKYQPLLLIPLGIGIILGNIPFYQSTHLLASDPLNLKIGIYQEGSWLYYLRYGMVHNIYPSLLLLCLGAMTDFSSLLSNPKLILIGLASQIGIFGAFALALCGGFVPKEAAAIGLAGCADGPASMFIASKFSPSLINAIVVSAYVYMIFVRVIQAPVMKILTTRSERVIRMKPPRAVSRTEKIMLPVVGLLLTCLLVPASLPLLGMLFLGNLIKESGVTKRLANTISGPLVDIVIVLTGLALGASTQADIFFNEKTFFIFIIGLIAFIVATGFGVLFVRFMNLFLSDNNKINPLIGNAGVSAIPSSASVSEWEGLKYDKNNHLLMHAMGPNAAGVIGSAIAAGVLISILY